MANDERWSVPIRVTYGGQRHSLELRSDDDVGALGAELSKQTGVPPARQRLICRGRVLGDAKEPLSLLAPRGCRELQMMLCAREPQRAWILVKMDGLLQRLIAFLELLWSVVYRFFHSLVAPKSYAGKAPAWATESSGDTGGSGGGGPGGPNQNLGDVAGMMAFGGGG
eukprot:TRINITY_DN50645_c0_g1_i1.p1 TRINITY_DN50645_c0_g1~~TRINITY_DN50645_c0_g1_i1.p1  ORF type:complete len:168 (-),score=27.43 TRINITY_DN50645_c0_g1_i1:189-692(-)